MLNIRIIFEQLHCPPNLLHMGNQNEFKYYRSLESFRYFENFFDIFDLGVFNWIPFSLRLLLSSQVSINRARDPSNIRFLKVSGKYLFWPNVNNLDQINPDCFYSSNTLENLIHKNIITILTAIVLIVKINFAIFNNS